MILALVQIPLPGPKRPEDEVIEQSLASSVLFRDVPGLLRKYYLNSETGGGGVYVFDSEANARAWFNDGWADWMEGRFGVRPTLTLFDTPVQLDNEAGEVRVLGHPVAAPGDRG